MTKHAGVDEATVRVWQDGQRLQTAGEDEGTGFDVDAPVPEQDSQETGLGLFSLRERLAALGGDSTLRSAPGEGTCVSLTVLLARAEPEEAALPAQHPGDLGHSRGAGRQSGPRGPPGAGGGRRPTCDRAPSIATMLSGDGRLEVIGEAADEIEAIEAVARQTPDQVLIDVNMPRMNGVETTRNPPSLARGARGAIIGPR